VALGPPHVAAGADPPLAVVGSWLIRSGPDHPLSITSLITYTTRSTCTQASVSHPHRGPAMGVWAPLDGRAFAVTFQAVAFDEAGHFTNVSQVRVQSVLDEDGKAIRLGSSGLVAATKALLEARPGAAGPARSQRPRASSRLHG
jgi:hypothetical protein